MSNDLIKSKILINKNKIEIRELLGSSSRLSLREVENIEYFAVQEVYGQSIDPEEQIFLKIEFNEKGKATSVELYSM